MNRLKPKPTNTDIRHKKYILKLEMSSKLNQHLIPDLRAALQSASARQMILLLFGVLLSMTGQAQRTMSENQVTEQPGFYIAPYTIYPGNLQVESTFQIDRFRADLPNFTAQSFVLPTALVRYGISDRLEVRAQTGYGRVLVQQGSAILNSQGDLIPLTLGAKVQVIEPGKPLPPIALRVHFTVPELGLGAPDFLAPSALVTTNVPFLTDFQTYLNLGIAWNGIDPAPTYQYGLALERILASGLTAYLEAYGFAQRGNLDHRYDAGLVYAITPDLQADLSGGIGFADPARTWFAALGFSFRCIAIRNQ